jgi:hypothetical protein
MRHPLDAEVAPFREKFADRSQRTGREHDRQLGADLACAPSGTVYHWGGPQVIAAAVLAASFQSVPISLASEGLSVRIVERLGLETRRSPFEQGPRRFLCTIDALRDRRRREQTDGVPADADDTAGCRGPPPAQQASAVEGLVP